VPAPQSLLFHREYLRDQSFWITSSEHQGTMPKRIFSFSCSMQVIQFADLHAIPFNQIVVDPQLLLFHREYLV
jgi:hypothetical protein